MAGPPPAATPCTITAAITTTVTVSGARRRTASGRTAPRAETVSSVGLPGGRLATNWVTASTASSTGTATSTSCWTDAARGDRRGGGGGTTTTPPPPPPPAFPTQR